MNATLQAVHEWVNETFHVKTGGRGYRFEGEQVIHEDELRQRNVSLSLMASATDDPDQVRMASEIEHDAEARLTVLLGKPQLTLAEKRERDGIQAALAARRQSFGGVSQNPASDEAEKQDIRRFLPVVPAAASPALAILLSPWTWLVALGAFCVLQMGLKERIEDQRDRARADLRVMERSRDGYAQALGQERAQRARDVAQVLEDTATTVDQMRRADARRRAREQRERQRNEDLARGTNDFARRLRELAAPDEAVPADPAATPSGGAAGAVPTGPDRNADDGAHP